jgi:hypothetical protein
VLTAVDARTADCRLCTVLTATCDGAVKVSLRRPVKAEKLWQLPEGQSCEVVRDLCTAMPTPAFCSEAMHAIVTNLGRVYWLTRRAVALMDQKIRA